MFFMLLETELKESLQLTDYGDAYFKRLPFLNELSYNFLLSLVLKNFRRSLKQSPIFYIFIETKPVKGIKNRHIRFFFCPWLRRDNEFFLRISDVNSADAGKFVCDGEIYQQIDLNVIR